MADPDRGLDYLLDLDGFLADVGGGFWIKVAARRVPADAERPHGIAYTLTLHEPGGLRVFGMDNAHRVRPTRGPAGRARSARDHLHRGGTIRPYVYRDAEILVADFLQEVAAFLRREGIE